MRNRIRPRVLCFGSALSFLAALLALAAMGSPAVSAATDTHGSVMFTLRAGQYRIVPSPGGERIEMEGFGSLQSPGRPMLPRRRILIALPPGTRAAAVEILDSSSTELTGRFAIAPCPSIVPVPGFPGFAEAQQRMRAEQEQERAAVFSFDEPVPALPAALAGTGSLRQYAYAAIDFSPLVYHPLSGRLVDYGDIRVAVHYVPSIDVSENPTALRAQLRETQSDSRARELFANYEEMAPLYAAARLEAATGPPPQQPTEVHDYVIVTTSGLRAAVEASALPAWKASLGHQPRIVLTTDPEIQTQPGSDLAQRIRNFLRAYSPLWSIRNVLLVGSYSMVPMPICYPDPAYHVYDPSEPGIIAGGTPTDSYYADLSDPDAASWDRDGDGFRGEYGDDAPDFLPEVAVGRIPVSNAARITYTLDKIVAFEQDERDWKRNVLQAGAILFFDHQDHGDVPFIDGATCLDSIETAFLGAHSVTRLSEQAGLVRSLFPWPPLTESSFTNSWRLGQYGIVNWSGHGWRTEPTGRSGPGTMGTASRKGATGSWRRTGSWGWNRRTSTTTIRRWSSPSRATSGTPNPIPTATSASIC